MRMPFFLLVLMGCLACAAKPAPNAALTQACVADRVAVLSNEWSRFESVTRQRVFHPDWRTQVRQWARLECSRGRPIAAFHPSDTATARRQY